MTGGRWIGPRRAGVALALLLAGATGAETAGWAFTEELSNFGPALATAGGLVFHGGTNDQQLRAHDADTGEVLARFPLPAGLHAGSKGKQKTTAELVIADLGGGQVVFAMGAYPNGAAYVIAETSKPGNGVLSGLTCSFDALQRDGFLLRADVKTKAGSDKATLKGTLVLFEEPDAESATCKITAKRVSTQAPKLPGCDPM